MPCLTWPGHIIANGAQRQYSNTMWQRKLIVGLEAGHDFISYINLNEDRFLVLPGGEDRMISQRCILFFWRIKGKHDIMVIHGQLWPGRSFESSILKPLGNENVHQHSKPAIILVGCVWGRQEDGRRAFLIKLGNVSSSGVSRLGWVISQEKQMFKG